ncbi:MAG: LysM peptidoglycan-binding domain-containing protein [Anaerolineaceae bacterium]|nr:LysM peptidoglycan-binding domain-containing protein [Anaerolineaceae bacterium]
MKKTTISIMVMLAAAVMIFAGCTRSASDTLEATPTLNVPVVTQAQVIGEELSQTATAAALEEAGEIEVIEATATEEPTDEPEPTATEAEVPDTEVPAEYTLQAGEWPICIARRFDLNIGTFFSLNGLSMSSRPSTGTTLKIPADSSWDTSYGERAWHAHPAKYTVAAGDTIYTIACYYGDVSPEQIAAKNGLEAPFTLTAGTVLDIP